MDLLIVAPAFPENEQDDTCMPLVQGGETFVPKIPSMRVVDMAEAVGPGVGRRVVGIRPGEKLHEVLLTEDEARTFWFRARTKYDLRNICIDISI